MWPWLIRSNCTCSICFENLLLVLFSSFPQPPTVNLFWSGFISVSTETTLLHQGVSFCHSPSPSLTLSPSLLYHLHVQVNHISCLSVSSSLHPRLYVSVFPSLCLRLSSHSDSYRSRHSLPVCLPVKVEPSFTLFCLCCHFFLSVFGKWIRQQEARSHTHLYTNVHAFDSLLEMPRLDGECGWI